MARKKSNFIGPERPFARVDLAHVRNLLNQGRGWVGFNTPYSDVLRPFFLDDMGKNETDYTLVDFGCGWGEHVILAGIGYPSMSVPRVKKAVGISADAKDIETAKLLYLFAQADPEYFRSIMVSADIGINIGFLSDKVAGMRAVLSSTDLSNTLRQILLSDDQDSLDSFMTEHIPAKRKCQYRQRLNGVDIEFKHTDLFNPDLPDNYADSALSSSVSSYIADPKNEEAMWRHILRICKPGATINAISFSYEREGRLTCAAEELEKVAEKYCVELEVLQVRNHSSEDLENAHKQTIFRVVDKPEFLEPF